MKFYPKPETITENANPKFTIIFLYWEHSGYFGCPESNRDPQVQKNLIGIFFSIPEPQSVFRIGLVRLSNLGKFACLRKSYIRVYIKISNKIIHKLYNFKQISVFDIIRLYNIIIHNILKILSHIQHRI